MSANNNEETTEEIKIPENLLDLLNEIAVREQFTDYSIIPDVGSNVGDGFLAIMIRIKIKGNQTNKDTGMVKNDAELNLICKVQSPGEFRKKFSLEPFKSEVHSYTRLLPAIIEFQREKGIDLEKSEGFTAFPKCLGTYANYESDEFIIVMEDLRSAGYRMWNKFDKLNYAHAKLALKELGRWHAISFALRDQKPELFEEFRKLDCGVFKKMWEQQMSRDNYAKAIDRACSAIDPEDTHIIEKINKLKTEFIDYINKCTSPTLAEPFSVINHGDCWNNNFMYRYSKDDNYFADGVSLIDWQLVQFCSPAADLSYFLFTSTEIELRDEHYDDLLHVYYDGLSTLLRKLGSDPDKLFTYPDLMSQMREFAAYGLVLAPLLLQILTVNPKDIPDMDKLTEDDDVELVSKDSENAFKTRIRDVIYEFIERGYY